MSIFLTYPQEVIERARQEYSKGAFKRKVLERKPLDFYTDLLTLDCGHHLTDRMFGGGIVFIVLEEKHQCEQCREEWMREAAKE